jgi:hypothetical protein
MGGLLASGVSRAGPLSMTPLLGLVTDYSSNPYLVSAGGRAVSDVALLVNAPTSYDLDAAHFSLTPSIRYSDGGGGYASLNSNYYHLTGSAAFSSDLNTLSLTTAFGRDSSLYQNGLSSNGIGVRSDSSSAGMDWQHTMTERSFLELDASWNRVLYNQGSTSTGLVDYRYLSVGSSAIYAASERDKLHVSVGGGQYQALDGFTKSKNYNLQLGFDRQLTEIWALSTSVGYSRSDNSQEIFYGPFFIGTTEYGPYYLRTVASQQKGPVYNVGLTRQGETLTLTASASRSFRPSGFEFLSRTDLAELDLIYTRSDRWTFGGKVTYQNTATPSSNGALYSTRYLSGQLSADWHWTPTWVISLHTTWTNSKYGVPASSAQSTGVSLEISRQFLRIDL